MSGQNPFEYNGSGIVAMKGLRCVAIASDTRLGNKFQTIDTQFRKVFRMQNNILMGLVGLATDVQTFHKKLQFKLKMYQLREGRQMRAKTFASLVGTTLYEHRFGPFLVQPLVVGLDDGEPIVYEYDYIGTQSSSESFGFIGTAGNNFAGCCESYYRDGLKPDELQDILANTLVSGVDRDILSGWGGVVYLLTEDDLSVQYLKTKMIQFNYKFSNIFHSRCCKSQLIVRHLKKGVRF